MSLLLLLSAAPPEGGFRSVLLLELGGIGASGPITGTLNVTAQNDTLAALGSPVISGTLSRTNADDTINATGGSEISGTLNVTENPDTLDADGFIPNNGELEYTNINDTTTTAGTTTVVGTLSKTNANDTLDAGNTENPGFRSVFLLELGGSGTSNNIFGTLNLTAQNDTLSAFANVQVLISRLGSREPRPGRGPYSLGRFFRRSKNAFTYDLPGVLRVNNNNDTISAIGWSGSITGTLTKTLVNDALNAIGNTSTDGTLSRTNANDTIVGLGTTTVVGTLAITDINDTLSSAGFVGNSPVSTSRLPLLGVGS